MLATLEMNVIIGSSPHCKAAEPAENKLYAGIGSRETPDDILSMMAYIAGELAQREWKLRSGGAAGADKAFEIGARNMGGSAEILRPIGLPLSNTPAEWLSLAEDAHPAWNKCGDWAKSAHGRNAAIILGDQLNDPVGLVICWTRKAEFVGGTAVGMRIAGRNGIVVRNLAAPMDMLWAKDCLRTGFWG